MIQAYPASASVAPGQRLVLHVSTDAACFRVRFYRWGDGLLPMQHSPWLRGREAPARGADDDWAWPPYTFDIPADWPSAVYIAHLEQAGGAPAELAATRAAALFVVRGTGRNAMLYKIPLATYHACNRSGSGGFHVGQPRSHAPPGARISLRRPGGGIGGDSWGAPGHDDGSPPRHGFAHRDAPFIGWLLRHGYQPEFCTDLDLHHDPGLCRRYRLMLSAGHDEYWSEPARNQVEDFVEQGGKVAFFSDKLCWRHVQVVDDGGALVCHHAAGEGMHAGSGLFPRKGTVFSAGAADWAHMLGSGKDPKRDRVARNLIDRLLGA
jgi:hypothetical protein